MEKSNNHLSRSARYILSCFNKIIDLDPDPVENILSNPDKFNLTDKITNWDKMNHVRNATIVMSYFYKKPELSVYYNGWQSIEYYHWETLFLTKLPIYLILAKNFLQGRIALMFYDKENVKNFTEWDSICCPSTWLDLLDFYPELSQKYKRVAKKFENFGVWYCSIPIRGMTTKGIEKSIFILYLNFIHAATFPSLDRKVTITGEGLTSKNGFKYRWERGKLITLPFKPLYNTYLHFWGCNNITSKMVEEQLGTYKSHAPFWMALMLAMELAIRNATNPNAIDM